MSSHLVRVEENAFGSKQAARRNSVSSLSIDAEMIERIRHFSTKNPNGSVVLLQADHAID